MGRFLDSLMRSIGAARNHSDDSRRYVVIERVVQCAHCAGEYFVEGRVLLNTAGMTFLKLDWANAEATTLICAECGRIEWFGPGADVREIDERR